MSTYFIPGGDDQVQADLKAICEDETNERTDTGRMPASFGYYIKCNANNVGVCVKCPKDFQIFVLAADKCFTITLPNNVS